MNADVEKALQRLTELAPCDYATFKVIRQALTDQEAEIARLNAALDSAFRQAMENGQSAQQQRARAEKAEALLRELTEPNAGLFPDLVSRITAHLGAEQ